MDTQRHRDREPSSSKEEKLMLDLDSVLMKIKTWETNPIK